MNAFDAEFYTLMHPECLQRSGVALLDYVRYGWKEGANPGPHFNTAWYLASYPEVMTAGMSPLEHFARFGQGNNAVPGLCEWEEMSPQQRAHMEEIALYLAVRAGLFSENFYRQTYPDMASELSGFDHYRRNGWKEMRVPSALFRLNMEKLPATDGNPLVALLTDSREALELAMLLTDDELRRQCMEQKLFDPDYYEFTYPEVAHNSPDSFLHFMLLGWRLGYNPGPVFNTAWYQEQHPGLKGNPLYHWFYTEDGQGGGFPAVRDFPLLPAPVRAQALDICAWEVAKRGWFDADFYGNIYQDVSGAGISAWVHYCQHGIAENRLPSPAFHAEWYLHEYLNSDPQNCALWHYLTVGEKRGDSAIPNDRLQILKEENALLFEQVWVLQKELQRAKKDAKTVASSVAELEKLREEAASYREKLETVKDIMGGKLL